MWHFTKLDKRLGYEDGRKDDLDTAVGRLEQAKGLKDTQPEWVGGR